MQQIHNGSFQNIELAIYKNGSLANADGNVLVDIVDADTDYVFITSGSANNLPATGLYNYQLTPSQTRINCVLKVTWKYALGGVNTQQETFIEIVTPYALVSDLIEYYNIGSKPSDINYRSEAEIIAAEKLARTQINYYTYQDFGRRYGYQEQYGSGSDILELVERMLTIDKVYENNQLVIDNTASPAYNIFGFPVELTQTKNAIRISTDMGDVRFDNQVDPTILYYGRFRDHARYKVVGEIGWLYVPQDIKLCATLLVGDILSKDYAWRTKYLKKINLAEVSFDISGAAFTGTGNVIVDGILDQYRTHGIIVI